jgi:hypothetical protein
VARRLATLDAIEKRALARVKAGEAKVPAELRAAWDAVQDPFAREAMLDGIERLLAAQSQASGTKVPAKPAGSSTPKGAEIDFDAAYRNGTLAELKAKDPEGFKGWLSSMLKGR